jgi:2-polyprenyl-6-hydroxyphenyl methylase/3-demethylubiquinone-9 3-methyltransferase
LNYIEERTGGLAGKRTLDVGCGGGILAESMALRGASGHRVSTWAKRRWRSRACTNWNPAQPSDYRRITAEELAESEPTRALTW